ncbi:DUF3793 family protein [Alkaliphilus hydrothermalis]|uniref:DUF3793 domain-containing protein n=1 Tax=Alkaliphilus hydrothermalis TaxID=1482730 RepID=A0ABS2NSR6_9FIRM|nr:DUF3793 family protein [Alkaliphilus hydrothermalis]MBM7616010.1 hypothetical protein [Alkaliphilus hydrothermalis]
MKINNCFCLNTEHDFLSWYVELLGPVFLGAKPAEILSFPQRKEKDLIITNSIKGLFTNSKQVQYKELDFGNDCIKMFFYNPNTLDETLKEARNLKFLKGIGYPEEYSLEVYLAQLINKINEGNIPDEIGVFLGYPLKDVLGFIGHPSLRLTKVEGWRVYGDTRLSDEKRNAFKMAREAMKRMLEHTTPEGIVLSA